MASATHVSELTIQPEIKIVGAPRSRSLQKLVENKTKRWIAGFVQDFGAQLTAGLPDGFPRILVRIENEEAASYSGGRQAVSCQVELRMAGRAWTASWYGRNPAQALSYCLQHMTERRLALVQTS